MRNFILLTVHAFCLISCMNRQNTDPDTSIIVDDGIQYDDTTLQDSLLNQTEIIGDTTENLRLTDTSLLMHPAPITKIPFSANFGHHQMTALTARAPGVYGLPPIRRLNYIAIVDTAQFKEGCLNKNTPVDTIFNFTRYSYKLPNVEIYETYLVCDTAFGDYSINNKSAEWIDCHQHLFKIHAYLLLYDPTSRIANVIAAYYVHPSSSRRRIFNIDKKFTITIQDYVRNREPGPFEFKAEQYTVTVLPNGEIKIRYPRIVTVDEYSRKIITERPAHIKIIIPEGIGR